MKLHRFFIMALVGLLLVSYACAPAYRSENPRERLLAISELESRKIINNLALNDPSPEVRLAAAQKVTDPKVIQKIILSDKENSGKIVRSVKEIELLVSTALSKGDKDLRGCAAFQAFQLDRETKTIPDTTRIILSELMVQHSSDKYVRYEGLDHIAELKPSLLPDIVLQSDYFWTQVAALNKIKSDDILMAFIKNDDLPIAIKTRAVYQLKNNALVNEIAFSSVPEEIRAEAVLKIDNQDLLLNLLNQPLDSVVKHEVIKKLISFGDSEVVRPFAADDSMDENIRLMTIDKLTDRALLIKMQQNPVFKSRATIRLLDLSFGKQKIFKAIEKEECSSYSNFTTLGEYDESRNHLTIVNKCDAPVLAVVAKESDWEFKKGPEDLNISECAQFHISANETKTVSEEMGSGDYIVFFVFSDQLNTAFKGHQFHLSPSGSQYSIMELTLDESSFFGRDLVPLK